VNIFSSWCLFGELTFPFVEDEFLLLNLILQIENQIYANFQS